MKLSIATLGLVVLASSANAVLLREFDASNDPAGDAEWANTSTANTSAAQNFGFQTSQTATSISDPTAPGITAAYDFDTTGSARGGNWSFFGQAGGGRANNSENTFETFFRLDDLSGTHIIFEIGGSAAGVSLSVVDNTLVWATNVGGNADPTLSIQASIGTGWHHAVALWNRNSLTTTLYLDGVAIGTVALPGTTTGWVGGNEGQLGNASVNASNVASAATTYDLGDLTDFDGAIAAFNYYNETLSEETIVNTFDANIVIPEPGSLSLLAVGLGVIAMRKRST